jgi:hypothetical protein
VVRAKQSQSWAFGTKLPGFRIPAPPSTSCVILNKTLNLYGPQYPHLPMGDDTRNLLTESLFGSNRCVWVKRLAQCPERVDTSTVLKRYSSAYEHHPRGNTLLFTTAPGLLCGVGRSCPQATWDSVLFLQLGSQTTSK